MGKKTEGKKKQTLKSCKNTELNKEMRIYFKYEHRTKKDFDIKPK